MHPCVIAMAMTPDGHGNQRHGHGASYDVLMEATELENIVAGMRRVGDDSEAVEVKLAGGGFPTSSLLRTVSAFANKAGGIILLGLDERDGFLTHGVEDPKGFVRDMDRLCAEKISPPIRASIEEMQFEGASVVVASVPELPHGDKPAYIVDQGMARGSYIRTGDSDRRLPDYEVRLLREKNGQPRHDAESVQGATLDDLENDLLSIYLRRVRSRASRLQQMTDTELLVGTGVLLKEGDPDVTVAGLLALGSFPQHFMPQVNATFVHFATVDGSESADGTRFIDNRVLDGPLSAILVEAEAAFRANMSRRASIEGIGRKDHWEYPIVALREAVVNALVHRDLSPLALGTQVQIEMYPDRLVVRNPGGLHGTVQLENIDEGVSSSRNATLMRILEDVEIPGGGGETICENRGSGIRAMSGALRQAGMAPPSFEDRISSFRVTFPAHTLLGPETVEWLSSLGEPSLTESQAIGLALLHHGSVLDNPTYRTATGVDSRVATAELQDLVARDLVTQFGTRRWAKYNLSVPGTVVEPGRPGRSAARDRRAEILLAFGDKTLSRRDIESATGLSARSCRYWLKRLVDEGAIERTTAPQSNRAEYRSLHGPGQLSLDLPSNR